MQGDDTRIRIAGQQLEFRERHLRRGSSSARLRAKTAAVLECLVTANGRAVRREVMLDRVWPRQDVGDHVLTQSVRELRSALQSLDIDRGAIETVPKLGYRLRMTPPRGRSQVHARRAMTAGILGVGVMIGVALWYSEESDRPLTSGAQRETSGFRVPYLPLRPVPVTAQPGFERFPDVSRDGEFVVYTGKARPEEAADLYVRGVESTDSIQLTRTGHDEFAPVISPDGNHVAFFQFRDDECALMTMPVMGGRARQLATCSPRYLNFLDWSPGGRSIVYSRPASRATPLTFHLARIDARTGEPLPLDYEQSVGQHDWMPRFSPDGRWLAFLRGRSPVHRLMVMPAAGGRPVEVATDANLRLGYDWLDAGSRIVAPTREGGIRALEVFTVPEGVSTARLTVGNMVTYPKVASRAAMMILVEHVARPGIYRLSPSSAGPPVRVYPSTRYDRQPVYSPQGDRVAFLSNRGGNLDLWIAPVGGDPWPATRLSRGSALSPAWSPDGRNLIFVHALGDRRVLTRLKPDSGRVTPLTGENDIVLSATYSNDGRHIYFDSNRGGQRSLWRMPARGGPPTLAADLPARYPRTFPGDPHVYFVREGHDGVWRLDPRTGEVEQFSEHPAITTRMGWALGPDGFYYLELTEEQRMGLYRVDATEGSSPALVHEFTSYPADLGFSLAPDGGQVLIALSEERDSDIYRAALDANLVFGGLAALTLGPGG